MIIRTDLAGTLQVFARLGIAANEPSRLSHPFPHQPVSVSVSVEIIWRLIHSEGHGRVTGYEIILYVPQKAKEAHHIPDLLNIISFTTLY